MSILDRLWQRLCMNCPVPELNGSDDLKRLERAQAYISLAQRETDIALRRERALSNQRRWDAPPQEKDTN